MARLASSAPVTSFAFARGSFTHDAPDRDDAEPQTLQLLCLSPLHNRLGQLLAALDSPPASAFTPSTSGDAEIPIPGQRQAEIIILMLPRQYMNESTVRIVKQGAPGAALILVVDDCGAIVESLEPLAEATLVASGTDPSGLAQPLTELVIQLQRQRAVEYATSRESQQQELHLRQLIDTLPLIAVQLDLSRTVRYANQYFCTWLGRPIDEILGSRIERLLGVETCDKLAPLMMQAYAGEIVNVDLTTAHNDKHCALGGVLSPYRNEAGECEGIFLSLRDVTERLVLQEQGFRNLMEMAHVSRLSHLGQIATEIAHELNQPLTAISTTATAMRRLCETGPQSLDRASEMLALLEEQSDRAGEIVKRFRQMARKSNIQTRDIELTELIDHVVYLASAQARHHEVKLHTHINTGNVWLNGERLLLEQALLNIIQNAIDALKSIDNQSREIQLETTNESEHIIRISVTDNGEGIHERDYDAIFDPFFTTKADGLGLGLSICRSIIETHGGSLTMEPGQQGAAFHIRLPVVTRNG